MIKKIMVISSIICLCLSIILFSTGSFGKNIDIKNANVKEYTKKQLTEDLRQLEKHIMKENPLCFADRDRLENLFLTTYEEIEDKMTELEFYRLINPIVTSINCGHTNLSISEALVKNRENTAKFFPIKVTLVDNGLYMMEDDIENEISSGDKIISINGKNSDEIINILIYNTSSDSNNDAKSRYIISRHFNNKFYDFVDNSDNFQVVLLNNEGVSKTVNLKAKFREQFNTSAWALHFSDFHDDKLYENEIYSDYAVLKLHFFMQEKGNKFDDYIEKFFIKLKDQNISKLIIDLRGNYGGGPGMAQSLISYLVSEKFDYFNCDLPFVYNLMGYGKPISPSENSFKGDVFILVDGAVFSTAGHFCSLVKYHNLGTLVGSKTGGTYICTDSSKKKVLKHTGLRLHYSTKTYTVAVEGLSKNDGVEPDITISPSIDDILNNKDVQMEHVLEILGKK